MKPRMGIYGEGYVLDKKAAKKRCDPIYALTLIFIALKLMGLISWPWLWVLSPIWLFCLFSAAVFSAILIGGRIVKGKW